MELKCCWFPWSQVLSCHLHHLHLHLHLHLLLHLHLRLRLHLHLQHKRGWVSRCFDKAVCSNGGGTSLSICQNHMHNGRNPGGNCNNLGSKQGSSVRGSRQDSGCRQEMDWFPHALSSSPPAGLPSLLLPVPFQLLPLQSCPPEFPCFGWLELLQGSCLVQAISCRAAAGSTALWVLSDVSGAVAGGPQLLFWGTSEGLHSNSQDHS